MNDFFRRAGPEPYRPRPPSTFRDSLAELRDLVRDGLAEAASRAVSGAVLRAAECLLGGVEQPVPGRGHARRREYAEGWGREYEDDHGDGWGDDPWLGRHDRAGRGDLQDDADD